MDYKERVEQFEGILSTKDLVNDPIIDLYKLRHLCFRGIPDKPGIRQKSWKLLLGYLPTDKRKWRKTLLESRTTYYSFVRDLLVEPSEEDADGSGLSDDHPLNPSPNSKWAEYFQDNLILEQIDKDVCRTLPDLAFFQQPVPQSPLSPLSPRLSPLELIRRNGAGSPSILETLDSFRDDISDLSKDSDSVITNGNFLDGGTTTVLTPLDTSIESLAPDTNRNKGSRRTSISSTQPSPIDLDSASYTNPITPIRTRRSIFKRVQHLNKDFYRRENRAAAFAGGKYDPLEDENQIDVHWEAVERILFIYAKLNLGIGYVQGMNEILGPIYYTMANDGDEEGRAHAEADSFFVFSALMADIRDHFVRSLDQDNFTGIGASMNKLNRRLKSTSYELWEDLESKSLHPPYYSFRWLTVMCAQEFALPDVIRIWDSLFADKHTEEDSANGFEFLIDFCCAMLICVKDQLLRGSFEHNIKLLQNYPIQDPAIVLKKAYELRESRLIAKLNSNDDTSSEASFGQSSREEKRRATKKNGLISSNGYSGRLNSLNFASSLSPSSSLFPSTRSYTPNDNQQANSLTNNHPNSFFRRPIFNAESTEKLPSSWFSPITDTTSHPSKNKFFSRDGTRNSPLIPVSVQSRVQEVAGQTKTRGMVFFNKVKVAVANGAAKTAETMNNSNAGTIVTSKLASAWRRT